MNNIHEMKLHELIKMEWADITRVPGGWIYELPVKNFGDEYNCVFVPYSEEFYKKSINNPTIHERRE